jgi:hypothetical protein
MAYYALKQCLAIYYTYVNGGGSRHWWNTHHAIHTSSPVNFFAFPVLKHELWGGKLALMVKWNNPLPLSYVGCLEMPYCMCTCLRGEWDAVKGLTLRKKHCQNHTNPEIKSNISNHIIFQSPLVRRCPYWKQCSSMCYSYFRIPNGLHLWQAIQSLSVFWSLKLSLLWREK